MKIGFIITLIQIIAFSFWLNTANAQSARKFKEFTWHDISTSIPADLNVVTKTDDVVELKASDVKCRFCRYDRSATTDEMLALSLLEQAMEGGMDIPSAALESLVSDNFAGAQLIGRLDNGNNVLMCGLVGLDTFTSYAIIVEYSPTLTNEEAMRITDEFELK